MAGAGELPLLVAPTVANVKMYHVLIDGGAGLNLLSSGAFKELQLPMSQLTPSKPFSGVSPHPIMPYGSICLPVTFGKSENY